MGYTFRVVFSGPCAYIPNILKRDGGAAKSWSIILPDLRKGWTGHRDGVRADRHLPVLRYSPDEFETTDNPDTILLSKNTRGIYQQSTFFRLEGHRITFDLPGANDLKVEYVPIDPSIRSDVAAVKHLIATKSPLLRSMDWLPYMYWLKKELEWFGYESAGYYFDEINPDRLGYPEKKNVAAHVILKQGNLIADELDTIKGEPTIWDFKPLHEDKGTGVRQQALAKSLALEVPMTDRPVSITIAYRPTKPITLTLRDNKLTGTPTIEIKNRELEEIFLVDDAEFEPQKIDLDFRYMYSHTEGYSPNHMCYLLPHWKAGGGSGNERGTCGGHALSGFADKFEHVLPRW